MNEEKPYEDLVCHHENIDYTFKTVKARARESEPLNWRKVVYITAVCKDCKIPMHFNGARTQNERMQITANVLPGELVFCGEEKS